MSEKSLSNSVENNCSSERVQTPKKTASSAISEKWIDYPFAECFKKQIRLTDDQWDRRVVSPEAPLSRFPQYGYNGYNDRSLFKTLFQNNSKKPTVLNYWSLFEEKEFTDRAQAVIDNFRSTGKSGDGEKLHLSRRKEMTSQPLRLGSMRPLLFQVIKQRCDHGYFYLECKSFVASQALPAILYIIVTEESTDILSKASSASPTLQAGELVFIYDVALTQKAKSGLPSMVNGTQSWLKNQYPGCWSKMVFRARHYARFQPAPDPVPRMALAIPVQERATNSTWFNVIVSRWTDRHPVNKVIGDISTTKSFSLVISENYKLLSNARRFSADPVDLAAIQKLQNKFGDTPTLDIPVEPVPYRIRDLDSAIGTNTKGYAKLDKDRANHIVFAVFQYRLLLNRMEIKFPIKEDYAERGWVRSACVRIIVKATGSLIVGRIFSRSVRDGELRMSVEAPFRGDMRTGRQLIEAKLHWIE